MTWPSLWEFSAKDVENTMGIQVEARTRRVMRATVANLGVASLGGASWGLLLVGLTPEVMRAQEPLNLPAALSYQSGQLNAEIRVNPLMRRLLGRTVRLEIPSEIQLEATDFAGHVALGTVHHLLPLESGQQSSPEPQSSVSIPTTALIELLDPIVNSNLKQLSDRYGLPPGLTAKQLNEIFHYQISGTGTLRANQAFQAQQIRNKRTGLEPDTSEPKTYEPKAYEPKTSGPASFEFTYDNQTERLQMQNLDLPMMLNQCESRTCIGELAGDLDFNLSIQGLLQVSEALDLKLPGSVRRLLRLAMVRRFASLDFAAGQFNAALKTQPHHTPTTRLSAMTQGDLVLHARRSTLPWSLLFSVPTARPRGERNFY